MYKHKQIHIYIYIYIICYIRNPETESQKGLGGKKASHADAQHYFPSGQYRLSAFCVHMHASKAWPLCGRQRKAEFAWPNSPLVCRCRAHNLSRSNSLGCLNPCRWLRCTAHHSLVFFSWRRKAVLPKWIQNWRVMWHQSCGGVGGCIGGVLVSLPWAPGSTCKNLESISPKLILSWL